MIGRVLTTDSLAPVKPTEAVKAEPVKAEPVKAERVHKDYGALLELSKGIGQRFRLVRDAAQISRPKAQELLGIPASTIKNYELNYRSSGAELLVATSTCEQLRPYTMFIMNGDRSVMGTKEDIYNVASLL